MRSNAALVGSFVLLTASGALSRAENVGDREELPSAARIVARLTEARSANRSRLSSFQVVRNYRLFGKERASAQSEVTASIAYQPPSGQQYTLRKNAGSSLGEMVVRKILDSEREVLAHQSESDVSAANYAFRLIGEDVINDKRCFVLELKPLRKDTRLLVGRAWVDKTNYYIVRLEGEPVKSPSWWIRNIHIVLDFGLVEGMWVQTRLESTANVHLLGPHTIEGRDVEYKIGGQQMAMAPVAAGQKP